MSSQKGRHFKHKQKRVTTEVVRKSLSRARRKFFANGGRSPRLGEKNSAEHRKKISIANSNKPRPWSSGMYAWNWKGGKVKLLREREKIAGRSKPEQCEICGCLGRICFDHDHKTGKFRGWICIRCNSALGLVKDNTETLIALIDYLRK